MLFRKLINRLLGRKTYTLDQLSEKIIRDIRLRGGIVAIMFTFIIQTLTLESRICCQSETI